MSLSKTNHNSTKYDFLTVMTFLLLFGFGLRIWDITARSLWFDEAVEYLTARTAFTQLPQAVITSNYQPPLMAYLLHGWTKIDISPLWLRYLPITFSMLTIAGIISWAKFSFGQRTALAAAAIITVMPTEIYYAQDVGEYAPMICLLTYALYFLDRARQLGTWRDWILWGVFGVTAVYTHYGAAIIIIPVTILVLASNILKRKKQFVQKQIMVGLAASLTALPLLLYFLPAQIRRVSSSFLSHSIMSPRQELDLFIQALSDTFLYNLIGWPLSGIHRWFGFIILVAIVILLLFLWFKIPGYVNSWLIGTFAAYYILVRIGAYDGFGFRYGLIFTPLFTIGAALLISKTFQYWQHFALAILGLAISIQIYALPHPTASSWLRQSSAWSPNENIAEPFAFWQTQREASDATYIFYASLPAFRYYLQSHGIDQAQTIPPSSFVECSASQKIEVCRANNLFYEPWSRNLSVDERRAKISDIMEGWPDRVWVFFSHTWPGEEAVMIAIFSEKYEIEDKYQTLGASVYLFAQ